jgi:hypothetical protein
MIHKTSTRRWAALASGALVAGGLLVAPAVVGLSAASAAPVALNYTCSGAAAGQSFSLPGVATIEATNSPDAVHPGADVPVGISVNLDLGSANFGPVTGLTGTFDVPLSLAGDSSTFTTKSITAPMTALVYNDSGTTHLNAPTVVGESPITVGTLVGNLVANPFGLALVATCVPDAGQDLTVGHVTVSEDAPAGAVPVDGTVMIMGTPKVGKTLKAMPGTSDGATITYQWLANGKAISKATKPSLKLTDALKGKKVSVKATYGKDGFLETVQTSKAVTVKKK